ncbi:Predicted metal-dependent hydrolase [Fructobacillus tropaeoli]|uniref:amidohydrolase family protein n=1 Tax=Fructobacillus tropaeoli TaxID=709323 RepID=UPI002DAFECF8|nr:Predicted metal-dependent hydrolase [Fructobacillus tropaeoli]
MKKIDGHVHLIQEIAGFNGKGCLNALGNGEAIWDDGTKIKLIPDGWGDTNLTAESFLKVIDAHSIEKAVLLQGSLNGYQNYYTYQTVKRYPERFIGAFAVDPFAENALSIVRRHVENLGFRAIKLEISQGGGLHGYHQTTPFRLDTDTRMGQIFHYLADYPGFTVTVDYGSAEQISHQPEAIAILAARYPQLDFVVCHLSFPDVHHLNFLENTLRLFAPHPNIVTDLSAIQDILGETELPFEKSRWAVALAKEVLGSKRLIWGTDSPWSAAFNSYEDLAGWLEKSELFTEDELADVYYGTANRIYFKKSAVAAARRANDPQN